MAVFSAKVTGLNVASVDLFPANYGLAIKEVNSSSGLEGLEQCNE